MFKLALHRFLNPERSFRSRVSGSSSNFWTTWSWRTSRQKTSMSDREGLKWKVIFPVKLLTPFRRKFSNLSRLKYPNVVWSRFYQPKYLFSCCLVRPSTPYMSIKSLKATSTHGSPEIFSSYLAEFSHLFFLRFSLVSMRFLSLEDSS